MEKNYINLYSRYIGIGANVKINNKIYFFETPGDGIYEINSRDGIINVGKVKINERDKRLAYYAGTSVGDKVYFIPYYASNIIEFDPNKKKSKLIDCNYKYNTNAVSIGGSIFFWSNKSKIIIKFDVNRNEYNEIQLPNDMYINAADNRNYVILGKTLYLSTSGIGNILKIDLTSGAVQVLFTGIDTEIYTLSFDGKIFWMTGTGKKIYGWEEKTQNLIDINIDNISVNHDLNNKQLFYSCVCYQKYIYLSPFNASEFIRVDRESKNIDVIQKISSEEIGCIFEGLDGLYLSSEDLQDGIKNEYFYYTSGGERADIPIDLYVIKERPVIYEKKRDNVKKLIEALL